MSLCSFFGLELNSQNIKSLEFITSEDSHNIVILESVGMDEREHIIQFYDIGERDVNFLLLAKLLGRKVVH